MSNYEKKHAKYTKELKFEIMNKYNTKVKE